MLLGRMYRIFQRYADIHVSFEMRGLSRADTRMHSVVVRENRMWITGHTSADRVIVQINCTRQEAALHRDPQGGDRAAFGVDVPLEIGDITLTTMQAGIEARHQLAGVTPFRLRRARAGAAVRYVVQVIALLPQIYRWKRQGNLAAREEVKQRLGLVPRTRALPLDKRLFDAPAPPKASPTPATLIMPVFNAFDLLPEALTRIAEHSGPDWRLILIEDCSTDPQVRPYLQDWSAQPGRADHVHLLVNAQNLGFVGSVNRALAMAQQHWPDAPVVLVNSDVNVPQGWLSRLLHPLADASVASVTPMTNDGEIFTVPAICQRGDLPVGAVDVLDAQAALFNPEAARAEAPTGVGFCMALAPQFLAQVPKLDTVFGRGYGEETDWCQKTRALGGRHLGLGNVFVEHRGGTSFGSAAKQRFLEKNLAVISRRYPGYDAQVQDYIRHDPMITARLALGLVWAGAQTRGHVPVYLAHSLGGGAEMYLQRRIAQGLEAGHAAVVLRVGQLHRWQIELHSGQGTTQGTTDDTQLLHRLMGLLPRRRIIYSCGVGDRDAVGLPDILRALSQDGAHPVEMLLHDYFPISPSYTLLGADGQYRGAPVAGTSAEHDPAHAMPATGGQPAVTLAQWQAAWWRLVAVCTRITAFSDASRALMLEVYPQAENVLEVVPHTLLAVPPRIAPGPGQHVIGVLGNIGVQKGAAVVARLAADLARGGRGQDGGEQNGGGHVVVVGYLDPDFPLKPPSQVHGAYALRDLEGLVARYGISCWLIPSIWPETFSFTTHEALATGLPVFAFDLGAQGEAVTKAVAAGAQGAVLPLPGAAGVDVLDLRARMRGFS